MKRFACGDVMPGCAMVFHAETSDEVLAQVGRHARQDHGVTDITPALVTQVRSHILAA